MTTEDQIRKELESIDWEAIDDQNRIEASAGNSTTSPP